MAFGTQIRVVSLVHEAWGLAYTGSHLLVTDRTTDTLYLYSWPDLVQIWSKAIPTDADTETDNIFAFTGAHIVVGIGATVAANSAIAVYRWPGLQRVKKVVTGDGSNGLSTWTPGGFFTGSHIVAGDRNTGEAHVLSWPGLQLVKTLTPDPQITTVIDMKMTAARGQAGGHVVVIDDGSNDLWLATWPGLKVVGHVQTDIELSPSVIHPSGLCVIGDQLLLTSGDGQRVYQLAVS